MTFNPSADSIQSFRNATASQKQMNFPKTTICKFCGKTELRGCMKNGRCRECYQGRTA